jgi:hypothetical protein
VVVEQTNKDISDISELLQNYKGAEHILFKTQETRFHKTGIINHAVKNFVTTKYAWVNDVDYYMKFSEVFNLDWNEKFIQPYEIAKKLNDDDTSLLLSGKPLSVNYEDISVKYISMYGALSFIFDVNEFISIGAMRDSVYGWGYEDVELAKRVGKKYNIQKIRLKGIHLWHPPDLVYQNASFNINEYFDKVYCINLDSATDKWKRVSEEFKINKIEVERVSAVNESEITDEQFLAANPKNIKNIDASLAGVVENKRALACLMSHLKVIQDAKEKKYNRILIFEDDIFIGKNFQTDIRKITKLKWKLLYLGASQFNWLNLKFIDGFYFSKNTLGTFAYAIDICAYDEIIELLKTTRKSADNLLVEFQQKWEDSCYTITPNIVISDVEKSEIRVKKDIKEYAKLVRWNLNDFVLPKNIVGQIHFDNGIRNLKELDRLFLKNGVEYWISCGTLLGFYRDGGFITHDTDIDLCVNAEHISKELLYEFVKNDFKIIKRFGTIEDGFQLSLYKRNIKVDIFFFYKNSDSGYHSVYSDFTATDYLKHDYVFSSFELVEKEFFGYMFSVPKDTEKYLIEQYGIDYTQKNKKWDYAKSPKNIVHTGKRINHIEAEQEFENYFYGELNNNLTLLIKSFMRTECVNEHIKSIRKYYKFIKIIVVDDSNPPLNFDYDKNIKTYNIPFDSGLSAGRNFGVSKIETDYFVLLDDDFVFTEQTDLVKWFYMMKNSNLDVLGGDVIMNNSRMDFFGNLKVNGDTLLYKNERYSITDEYKTCDLVLNFFIAKTKKILECKWDEELKLAEHTAYFLKYKNILKVGHTEKISILHKQIRDPTYAEYRKRARDFLCGWMKKTGINKIINFDSHVTQLVDGDLKSTQTTMVNKKYWDSFYINNKPPMEESSFAKFTLEYILNNRIDANLIDVGCGNGRDLFYFLNNQIKATGLETTNTIKNENVIIENMTKFDYSNHNIIYLRFLVHTVREEELELLIERIKLTAKECLIFIETRSVKGIKKIPKLGTFFQSPIGDKHFRMLYSESYLTEKLKQHFEILYKNESNGLAIYKEEDPVCIRYVLKNAKNTPTK